MNDLSNLFDDIDNDQEDQADGLDDLFPQTSETKRTALVSDLLAEVVEAGGVAPVDYLMDRGHSTGALRIACTKPEGDKRKQPLLRPHTVDGIRVVTLTSSGWSAMGHGNKREMRPTPSTVRHSVMPSQIRKHVEAANPRFRGGITLRVANTHSAVNEWQRNVVSKAWAYIQGPNTDQSGAFGQLTRPEGCPRPDALIYEEWAEGYGDRQHWGNRPPAAFADSIRSNGFVILTHLLEVETAEKRTDALTAKVERLNASLDLHAADTVLWAVDSDAVAQRIRSAVRAVNTSQDDPRHLFTTTAHLTGRGIVPPVQGVPGWWATQWL